MILWFCDLLVSIECRSQGWVIRCHGCDGDLQTSLQCLLLNSFLCPWTWKQFVSSDRLSGISSVHFTVTKITKVLLLSMFPYFLFWFFNYVIYVVQAYWNSCAFHEWCMSDESSLWDPQAQMSCSAHLGHVDPVVYLIRRDPYVGCFILGSWLLF